MNVRPARTQTPVPTRHPRTKFRVGLKRRIDALSFYIFFLFFHAKNLRVNCGLRWEYVCLINFILLFLENENRFPDAFCPFFRAFTVDRKVSSPRDGRIPKHGDARARHGRRGDAFRTRLICFKILENRSETFKSAEPTRLSRLVRGKNKNRRKSRRRSSTFG